MGMFARREDREVGSLACAPRRKVCRAVWARMCPPWTPGTVRCAVRAMNDASERNNVAGGLLARAHTAAVMRVALRIVVEGLQATRVVREHQGLSLGPDLPDVTSPATVATPTPVNIGEQQITAHPEYHPQQPHYFGGGTVAGTPVPGGYYRTPFWKKAMMIGGAVAGGEMLGDLLSGGGDRDYGGGSGWGGDGGGDWGGGDGGW